MPALSSHSLQPRSGWAIWRARWPFTSKALPSRPAASWRPTLSASARKHSDIGTQFNAIPFPASGQARSSDFYGSGRASRLSLLAKGNWGHTIVTGYDEADFLGVGVTSNPNQSNSYGTSATPTLGPGRLPQWVVSLGGQMWSLAN